MTALTPDSAKVSRGGQVWQSWTLVGLIGVIWLPVLARLQVAWSSDPELWHGWAVPVVAAWMARMRWEERPGPVGRDGRELSGGLIIYFGALAAVMAWLLVLDANPAWPTAQWAGALLATTGTLGLLGAWGGRAAWRTFGFPLFFMHTALACPAIVREPVMNFLMQTNASIAAEMLSLLGKTAVVRGNLIEVEAGIIGVEEACSGLRSLQAVWMFAWLFAGVNRLSWSGRWRVVAAAVGLAWVGNLARTLLLTWRIDDAGAAAGEAWHDTSGAVTLVLTLGALYFYALRIAARDRNSSGQHMAASDEVREKDADVVRVSPPRWARGTGARVLLVAVTIAVTGEAFTAWWYRAPAVTSAVVHWRLHDESATWRNLPVSDSVQELLRCSEADQLQQVALPHQPRGLALVLRWEHDRTIFSSAVAMHDPTVCMPAMGGRLEKVLPPVRLNLPGGGLEFAGYVFQTSGRTQHVFNAVWDVVAETPIVIDDANGGATVREQRINRIRRRSRFSEIDRIVMVVENIDSDEAAITWLRATADRLLVRE